MDTDLFNIAMRVFDGDELLQEEWRFLREERDQLPTLPQWNSLWDLTFIPGHVLARLDERIERQSKSDS